MHRSKLQSFIFIQHITGPKRERTGKYALHGLVETVEWVRDRLAAPHTVPGNGAQIVDLHDDGVPERARVRGRVRVRGRGYLEAASASATSSAVGTKCEFVDRCRVPAHPLATRCRRTSRSAWSNHDESWCVRLQADWQPPYAVKDAPPLGFCTQPPALAETSLLVAGSVG